MALLSSLTDRIAPETPGALDSTIDLAVSRAAADFFRRAEVWRVPISGATYGTNRMHITSGLEVETRLMAILELRHGSTAKLLDPANPIQMARKYPNEDTGTPKVYAVIGDDEVEVAPFESSTDTTFQGRGIIVPTLDMTIMPDELFDQYEEIIMHGALYRLLGQPQKTWTNVTLAREYRGLFEIAANNQRVAYKRANRSAKISKTKAYGGLLD